MTLRVTKNDLGGWSVLCPTHGVVATGLSRKTAEDLIEETPCSLEDSKE